MTLLSLLITLAITPLSFAIDTPLFHFEMSFHFLRLAARLSFRLFFAFLFRCRRISFRAFASQATSIHALIAIDIASFLSLASGYFRLSLLHWPFRHISSASQRYFAFAAERFAISCHRCMKPAVFADYAIIIIIIASHATLLATPLILLFITSMPLPPRHFHWYCHAITIISITLIHWYFRLVFIRHIFELFSPPIFH